MKTRKILSVVIILAFVVLLNCSSVSLAYGRLYTYSDQHTIQKTGVLTVYLSTSNYNKKPKWSVSNKSVLKIQRKSRNKITVKGKSTGTAKIICKVGKKKYKYKITVKPKSKIDEDHYDMITVDMTYDEVCDILGGEGKLEYSNPDYFDKLFERYRWENKFTYSYISVEFEDGIVTDKSWLAY